MKNRDWLFVEENKIFNYRSTGVLIQNGNILIQRGINDVEFALPGGHVAWGETSAETLIREYKEEICVDIVINRLIWVEETFWKWGKRDAHTICHYHLVSLKDPLQIPNKRIFKSLDSDESRLIFQWIDLKQIKNLKDVTVYPLFL